MTANPDDARKLALGAGLGKLDAKHLTQLAQSMASTSELAAKLPKNLHWSEEIAVAFRLTGSAGKKP